MAMQIKWNKKALAQFAKAIAYVEEQSPAGAEKWKADVLEKIDGLIKHPERYNPDKYKTANDGSFRAFELHHHRISNRYKNSEIRIIRIRHTKMNPLLY